MSNGGLFHEAVHGLRWMGITKGASQVLMWVVTVYVVRLLAPEDYGVMAMAGILTMLVGLLLDAGLGAALVQRQEVPKEVYQSANGALFVSATAIVLIVQLLAVPLARFFSEPILEPVLRVAAIQFPVGALAVVPASILMKQRRFKELGIADALSGVGGSLFALGFALADLGVWALVAGALSTGALRMLFVNLYAGRPMGFSLRLSRLRSYLSFSANLLGERIVWFYVEQVDHLLIGKVLGASALGTYSVARHLSHVPLDRTARIVNQVTLPSFAAVQDEKERWYLALQKLVRLSAVLAFPLFVGMASVAPVALPLLLGDRWDEAVVPFVLFCLALPLRTAHSLVATVLFALGRAQISFRVVLIWAAVLTPMFVVGLQFGVGGVAGAWAIGFPIAYLLGTRLVASALSIPLSSLWAPMLGPAIAAAGMAGIVLVVQSLCEGVLPAQATLALQILAGALTYGVLLRIFFREAFDEIFDLLGRLVGKKQPA